MGLRSSLPKGEVKQSIAMGQIGVFQLINQPERKHFLRQQSRAIETIRVVESQQIFLHWLDTSKKVLDDDQSEQLVMIPRNYEFTTTGRCGTINQVNLLFDCYEYVMSEQIMNRLKKRQFFSEQEMWYMLYNFVRMGSVFQLRRRNKMGNFHPSKLVINDSGQIKFVSILSLPDEQTNFQQLHKDKTDKYVYLAPQEYVKRDVTSGIYPIQVDPCRADTFSIGLTLLSICLLQDCADIYIKQPTRWFVDFEILKNKLNMAGQRYSGLLLQMIRQMLELSPDQRKRCSDMKGTLKPYESQILNMKHFAYVNRQVPSSASSIKTGGFGNSGVGNYFKFNSSGAFGDVSKNNVFRSDAPKLSELGSRSAANNSKSLVRTTSQASQYF